MNESDSTGFNHDGMGWEVLRNDHSENSSSENTNLSIKICNDMSPYPDSQVVLRLYLIGPVAIIGLITNLINIRIFTHETMRPVLINWFLLSLSISDSLVVITTLLMLSFPVLVEHSGSIEMDWAVHYLTRWSYPVANLSQTLSIYLVVMVTCYRYLGICHPFFARTRCNARNVAFNLMAVFLFALVFTAIRWIFVELAPCYSKLHTRWSVQVAVSPAFAESWIWGFVYQVLLYLIVMFLVPFATLCHLNYRFIQAIRASTALRKKSMRGRVCSLPLSDKSSAPILKGMSSPGSGRNLQHVVNICERTITAETTLNMTTGMRRVSSPKCSRSHGSSAGLKGIAGLATRLSQADTARLLLAPSSRSQSQSRSSREPLSFDSCSLSRFDELERKESQRDQSITVMMVIIVSLFLICNSLPFLNNLFEILGVLFDSQVISRSNFTICVEVGNLLVIINSSCYLFIYVTFNLKYRNTFVSLFALLSHPRKGSRSTSTFLELTETVKKSMSLRIASPSAPEKERERSFPENFHPDSRPSMALEHDSFRFMDNSPALNFQENFEISEESYETCSDQIGLQNATYLTSI